MLREHLSQAHDGASRRFAIIDGHVAWIHRELLGGSPSRILDLGCGPGLYANRLAALGHACTGIDFSPASIAYAREVAAAGLIPAAYVQGDLRSAAFGSGYDLAMFLYGELNIFRPAEALDILRRAAGALAPGGRLLAEVSTATAVRAIARSGRRWYSAPAGLWSDEPHLCLEESAWDGGTRTCTARHYIIDARTAGVQRHAVTYQAYTGGELRRLLRQAGFGGVSLMDGVGGVPRQDGFMAFVAQRC